MKPLQLRLLLSACLLIVSLGPALAASCSPRMSPLRCLFASLHALRSPPHAHATRHAARPRPAARKVRARIDRRGQASRVAWTGHRRGRSPAAATIAAVAAPSLAVAAGPTIGADQSPDDPAQASVVATPRDRAPQETALIGAPAASAPEQSTSEADPAEELEVSAEATPGQDAAASADGLPAPRPAAQGVAAAPADGTSIRRLFGLSGDASPASSGPMVGGAAEPDVELRALPAAFVELRPYLADLRYFIADDCVVLVLPETRLVVMTY